MDFKKIISHIQSIDGLIETPAAPEIPKAVQLNEDAQLRVLSGRSTYVAEAKKKAEDEKVAEEMKVGDKKTSATGGTIEKTATGIKHTAGKNYGGDKAPKDDEEDAPKVKKAKKESFDAEAFKGKFAKMVEAKKDEKKDPKKKTMKEAAKPDFLDMDKDGDKKEPMKDAAKDSKNGSDKKETKGLSAKQKKLPAGLQKAIAAKTESKMMPKGKKRPVKESFEQALSFRDMMKLVIESGGQQQIDPLDKELFAWATRVAQTKFTENMKAEVYAGMVYERMGGQFEMYDVLSEDQN